MASSVKHLKKGMGGSNCGKSRTEKTEYLKKYSKKKRRQQVKKEIKNF